MTPTKRRAWHFTDDTLRGGSPIPAAGEWLVHDGDVATCESWAAAWAAVWATLEARAIALLWGEDDDT